MTFTRAALLLLVLAYIVVGVLFAVFTPDWQTPDEPAHYNYVRQVAEHGCCPVIEPGDWQQEYQNRLTSERFNPALLDRLPTIQYEDHQPPLYYVLAAPVFRLTNGSLTALRIFSVLIGAGAVICVYAIAYNLYPDRPGVVVGSALFFAFLPQHIAMLSAVNNDGLAEFLIALTLLALVRYLQDQEDRRQMWAFSLGVLVGLIFLTKSTGYFMAAVAPVVILLHWWNQRRDKSGVLRAATRQHLWIPLIVFLLPALLMGLVWWGRNVGVYGFPDFLGLRAHDTVVADQLRTADYIAQVGQNVYLSRAATDTFNSFFGQFGWMALPLQPWMYRVFQALLLVAAVGFIVDRLILRSPVRRHSVWMVFALVMLFAALAYVYYNTEFLQFQGRYLYPGLVPFALLIALGVDAWWRWLLAGIVPTLTAWLPAALFALFIPLDLYLLLWVIRPLLAP